jgi:aminoglycoside phosphotransferase
MTAADLQNSIPPELAEIIRGYAWCRDHLGESAATVFRLEAENKSAYYLKISQRLSGSLRDEKMRLDWLQNRLPVPEVLFYAADETSEYLLTEEISGLPASDKSFLENLGVLIEEAVSGLRLIHGVEIADCPFDSRLDRNLDAARNRMIRGQVDEDDFDEERLGRTAGDLFAELSAGPISDEDLVFTHGDYCLPNIILKNNKLAGFIDWGNAGVADRYQDLALLSRSMGHNFGAQWEERVFERYGIEPDREKIKYYRLLDEFF